VQQRHPSKAYVRELEERLEKMESLLEQVCGLIYSLLLHAESIDAFESVLRDCDD
jgi:hypothetical protein